MLRNLRILNSIKFLTRKPIIKFVWLNHVRVSVRESRALYYIDWDARRSSHDSVHNNDAPNANDHNCELRSWLKSYFTRIKEDQRRNGDDARKAFVREIKSAFLHLIKDLYRFNNITMSIVKSFMLAWPAMIVYEQKWPWHIKRIPFREDTCVIFPLMEPHLTKSVPWEGHRTFQLSLLLWSAKENKQNKQTNRWQKDYSM